jgi:hypothetical protein
MPLSGVTLTIICSYGRETIIAVLVGPDEHEFAIHKDVVCAKSGFFCAACSTAWTEGREKVVRLPEVEPEVFRVYVDWAYTDALVFEADSSLKPANETSSRGIVNIYLLGDVLDDVRLRNKAMELLNTHAISGRPPNTVTINYIWDITPTKSRLRKWIVDVTITGLSRESFVQHGADYPAELVFQLATTLLQQTKTLSTKELEKSFRRPSISSQSQRALVECSNMKPLKMFVSSSASRPACVRCGKLEVKLLRLQGSEKGG